MQSLFSTAHALSLALHPLADSSRLEMTGVNLNAVPRWIISVTLSSSRMGRVEHVTVHECPGTTDALLSRLGGAAHGLLTLRIRSAPAVTGRALRLSRLQELVLEGCDVDDASATALSSGCPALLSLTVRGASRLCDAPISSPSLRRVSLQKCRLLVDATITAICEGCPALQELRAEECPSVVEPAARSLSLRRLEFEECSGLAASALSSSHLSTPALTSLSLAYCRQPGLVLDDAAWPPELQRVKLDGCHALTDHALGRLCSMSVRLEALSARSCPLLRSPHISGASLVEVDLGSCEGLVSDALRDLLDVCPSLSGIDVSGASLVVAGRQMGI